MYIKNKEIIRCLFDNEAIDHAIYNETEFGASISGFSKEGKRIKSLSNIGISLDDNDIVFTEHDNDMNVIGCCCIPLPWLLRNSSHTFASIR